MCGCLSCTSRGPPEPFEALGQSVLILTFPKASLGLSCLGYVKSVTTRAFAFHLPKCCNCGFLFSLSHLSEFSFFKRFYLFILERKGGRKSERNINVWLPLVCPPTRDLARNPGMCPDWESNQRPSGSQAQTQSTEPHQPGLLNVF